MNDLKINPKFKDLLPALSEEEFTQLEESILAEGVRESVELWQNQIVDGHNRVSVCEKHNLDFPVKDMFFADEDAVLEWIDANQLGRRNLTAEQKTLVIGRIYERRKKKAGAPIGSQNAAKINSVILTELILTNEKSEQIKTETEDFSHLEIDDIGEIDDQPAASETVIEYDEDFKPKPPSVKKNAETARTVAKDFGVSPRTVERAGKVYQATQSAPELRRDFLDKKISQKAVIEKAKEITEPKLPPSQPKPESETDDFTETAARHGRKIHALVSDLQAAITAANNDFARYKQDFDNYGDIRRISLNPLKEMEWKTRLLKTLKKCANCKGAKCEKCKQTGYQNKSNYSTTKGALESGK